MLGAGTWAVELVCSSLAVLDEEVDGALITILEDELDPFEEESPPLLQAHDDLRHCGLGLAQSKSFNMCIIVLTSFLGLP